MRDQDCSTMMDTPCTKDYKKVHYWERRGLLELFHVSPQGYIIWQCAKCGLCIKEKIKWLAPKKKE